MSIPGNIKSEHISKAMEEHDRLGTPHGRRSTKFSISYEGRYYPPKYIISLANRYANGKELSPSRFSGGNETNNFLVKLGFQIVSHQSEKSHSFLPKKDGRQKTGPLHNERCPQCKGTIKKFLEKIYGRVEVNYRFNVGARPDDFKNSPYHKELKEIYESLQNYRGFNTFINASSLPNCDYFVPNPGFIVEFDESQHFSQPREVTLSLYPDSLALNFDKDKWSSLCRKIRAKDPSPPFRDEQRAWYDSLRDFLPSLLGLQPTVRLYSRARAWCGLDINNPEDIRKLEGVLRNDLDIEIATEPAPFFARIIIAHEWNGNPQEAKRVLDKLCGKWPEGKKVNFLITCGGFVQFPWPVSLKWSDVGDNKYPNQPVVDKLIAEAERCVKFMLSNGLDKKLSKFTRFLTIGIDSFKEKISTTQNYIGQLHVELVALIDLRSGKIYWIGKSYPTSGQEAGLIRFSDLESHFVDLDDIGEVMILGCHDLTVFNPRSDNAKGWRARVNNDFRQLAKRHKPKIVFQHPHTTDCNLTWAAAWGGLKRELPTVKVYGSAGRYHNPEGVRSTLAVLLEKTKCGRSIDFIFRR